ITKLFPDDSRVVRSAEVFVKGKTLIKTIEKLVPLEADITDKMDTIEEEVIDDHSE
ncbi:hypothetical protein SK128_000742, partial [Halocaridina rubra]